MRKECKVDGPVHLKCQPGRSDGAQQTMAKVKLQSGRKKKTKKQGAHGQTLVKGSFLNFVNIVRNKSARNR